MTISLWRHADFMKLWAGQTVSELGSVVTRTAVPLVALLVLGAGPFEMALIIVSASLAVLLVGFFAGAWVDRLSPPAGAHRGRRPARGLLFSIPAAYLAGVLRMEQLYVVVFLEGCLGAFFDAAYPAYVPSLIGVDRVVDGNSKLATSSSLAEIGGPGLAGGLVQLIGAPFAILVDAFSYVVSAISLLLIRAPEPPRPARTDVDANPRTRSSRGSRLVRRHALLLPLTLRSVIAHVAGSFYGVLYMIYLIEELHLEPLILGIVVSAGGVGRWSARSSRRRAIRRLGIGPALIWTRRRRLGHRHPDAARRRPRAACLMVLPAAADRRRAPDDRGRRGAVADPGRDPRHAPGPRQRQPRGFSHGIAYPLGALLAAAVAGSIGVRGGIAIGWAGMAASILLLVFSPLPRQRQASDAVAVAG